MSSIQVSEERFADTVAKNIRGSAFRSQLQVCTFVGVFFGFSATALTAIASRLLIYDFPRAYLPVVFLVYAALFSFGWWLSSRKMRDDLRRDLRDGLSEVWTLQIGRVVRLIPEGSYDALGLDCESQSVVLLGSWWRSDGPRSDIEWSGAGRAAFPSRRMVIRVLPSSRRVICVETDGPRIEVTRKRDESLPFLAVPHVGYTDFRRFEVPLDELIDWRVPAAQDGPVKQVRLPRPPLGER